MMAGVKPGPNVFTIPSGTPFLPALARAVLSQGFPASDGRAPGLRELSRWTILLPTRRTVRELSRIFLDLGAGEAAILPRIRPIGDVDDHEHVLSTSDEIDPDLPPAIPPAVRHFLLARLINEWADAHPATGLARALSGFPGQVFALARSLGELIDSFETEEVSLDEIEKLMGADFSEHRLAMLDFLSIIRKRLPEEISARGFIGHAMRRSLLLRREAARLEKNGADGPIIAAGSTGSIRATANLLRVIARLDEGAVVLPGLDLVMDEASWRSLADEPGHSQFILRELLATLGVARSQVGLCPGVVLDGRDEARLWLTGEMMRPADTTDGWWQSLRGNTPAIRSAMQGVELIEAADQREEARLVATIMRQCLEEPHLTARAITPSRRLARRIRSELKRWGIEIADAAGESCASARASIFLRLLVELGLSRCNPREFVESIKHPLFRLRGGDPSLLCKLEIALLRGALEPKGVTGLRQVLAERLRPVSGSRRQRLHPALARLSSADWRDISAFIDRFARAASPFLDLLGDNRKAPLEVFIRAHLECAEALTTDDHGGSLLWRGEEGEILSDLFTNLLDYSGDAPDLSPADYAALLNGELAARVIRPRTDDHPRLAVMGLLEARLLSSDIVILAGLNHGLWPAEAEIDPWLSRPMKAEVNLASPDRRIGLSAHDFVQNFASPTVYVTWSRKIDGVPTVPSRWITRLEAVLSAAGAEALSRDSLPWLSWAAALDHAPAIAGATQPRPAPPVAARPRTLSVTRIEKLIANPYYIFAEKVLGLEPLEPLAKRLSAADRGSLVHDALRLFAEANAGDIGDNALDRLLAAGHAAFSPLFYDPQVQAFWWPQFERIAQWFIDQERLWRQACRTQHCEIAASATVSVQGVEFTITARADRIDALADGSLRIIDYKTGQLPAFKSVDEGFSPQLPLEAWLAAEGAFTSCASREVSELIFVRLSGGNQPGELRQASRQNPAALAASAHSGLLRLLADYASPSTPYVAVPEDDELAAAGDIHHLARTREWSHTLAEKGGS
jgi:ATP-dependent helicase/nuclease subunit B